MILSHIKTKEDLARALGVQFRKHLVYYLYRLSDEARYRPFQIKKRAGGLRTIHAPHHGLKTVQKKLAAILALNYGKRSAVHGFLTGRSIITNAQTHVRARYVLNIDLKDFFTSINLGRVRGILQSTMYGATEEVATVIAQICCFQNSLPQGAPTSPIISNMICGKLDAELKALAREFHCTYTRYCDDITFSTDRTIFPDKLASVIGRKPDRRIELGPRLVDIIVTNGFEINESKTRLLTPTDRQEVTGLVVNRFVNVPRLYIRNLRATLHAWRKFGLEGASQTFAERYEIRSRDKADFQSVVFGKIQYVGAVRGFDDEIYRKLRTRFNALSSLQIPLHDRSREFTLENAIWVLESDGDLEDLGQGTAFSLDGVGLVTCAHCIGEKRNFIYQPANPAKHIDVKALRISDDIDLAVLAPLDPQFEPAASFKASNDSDAVQRGDDITLAGFPKFGPGSRLSVKDGAVQSIKFRSGIRRFNVSTPIITGNSGGPVFNKRGQVIGVATTGTKSIAEAEREEAHGVIPISALKQF